MAAWALASTATRRSGANFGLTALNLQSMFRFGPARPQRRQTQPPKGRSGPKHDGPRSLTEHSRMGKA